MFSIEFTLTQLGASTPVSDIGILSIQGGADVITVPTGTSDLQISDGVNTSVISNVLTHLVPSVVRVVFTANTMQIGVDGVAVSREYYDGTIGTGNIELVRDGGFAVKNISIYDEALAKPWVGVAPEGVALAEKSQLGYPNLGRVAYPTAYFPDVEPDQFTLPADVAEASLGQLVEFNFPVAGTAAGAQVPYVATNCQISTDNVNFFGNLNAVLGQTIYGRATAALGYQASTTYTVTSGIITDSFTITTAAGVSIPLAESSRLAYPALGRLGYPTAPPIDIQPNQFTLPDDVVNSPLGGLTEFNFVVSGTDAGEDVPFLGTNCTLSTDNVTFTASVNAVLGQTVYGRAYAALSSLEETTHTVTSGIITDSFTITATSVVAVPLADSSRVSYPSSGNVGYPTAPSPFFPNLDLGWDFVEILGADSGESYIEVTPSLADGDLVAFSDSTKVVVMEDAAVGIFDTTLESFEYKVLKGGVVSGPFTYTINVVAPDTTIPVITVTGGTTEMLQGGVYTPPTVEAVDNIDGVLTVNQTGTIDVNVVGTQTVYFDAADSNGNEADQVSHTVVITALDSTPTQFTFVDQTGIALNTPTVSAAITVLGINTGSAISITGGEYSVNGGTYETSAGVVNVDDTVVVRVTSSGSNNTPESATLTIGGVSDTFTVTTIAIPSNYTSSGGDVSGGLGLTSKSKSYLPSGGSVEGGTGDASESKYYSPEGGEVSGGLSYTYKIKSYQGAYGEVSGGLSYTSKTKYYQGTSGEVAGGTSQTYKTKYYLGTEGDISGGEGDYRFVPLVRLYTPQGGDVSGGGESLTFKSKSYLSSGGDVSGGDYVTTYKVRHYLPIGGDVSGGFSTLYSFIEAVPLVRIPTRVGGICRRYRSVFDVTKLVFQRYLPAYLNDNNDLVTPEGISMSVVGDLQPLDTGSSAQVEPPSGYTLTGGWKFSSKALLNTLDGLCSTRSDTVEIGGRTYYVWRSLDWQSGPLATDEYVQYFLIMKRLPNGG